MNVDSKPNDRESDTTDPLRAARELWRSVGELRTALKGKRGPEWLKPPDGNEVGTPTKDDPSGKAGIFEVAEVDLADGVQPFLAKAFEASYDPTWDDDEESRCKAWIDARRAPSSGSPLPVILGQELIGTLAGEDALSLEHELRKAERAKRPLILEATIERERGSFSVWVTVPPTN